jgi:hypothetical protein
VGKPEGKRPLGRPRRRWVDNIKIDLREIGWDWIDMAQDRDQWRALVNTVLNLYGIQGSLLCSQWPAAIPCVETVNSSQHNCVLFL